MSLSNLNSCKPGEYDCYKEERIMEQDLSIKGLYTLMLKLQSGSQSRDFKCPSQVVERVATDSSGLYAVKFNLLDPDFRPVGGMKGHSADGYFQESALDVDMTSYFRELDSHSNPGLYETSVPTILEMPVADLAA